MGVAGVDGDAFEEETASRWVGNADEEGAVAEGRKGASSADGKRDFGKELGMESRFTAAIILQDKENKCQRGT